MEKICCIIAGLITAAANLVYIVKLLILRFTGLKINAEVVAVREVKQGTYVHTLEFDFKGKIVRKDDKTGYSQPFSKGDVLEIVCSRKNPDNFEYASAIKKNIIVATVAFAMAVLIMVRFAFFVTE